MKKRINSLLIMMAFSAIIFAQAPAIFNNPIIPGFHPDPSVCRVGDDYYLVNSSFEWFPGIPIFHSNDLVNWEQIGHVLTRPSQLMMKDSLMPSNGIWAPTIRYHDGLFYVIGIGQQCGGQFFVTAKDPKGPWSDPVYVDAPGIDPEIFWDDDGKSYFVWCSQGKIPPARRWKWEDRIYIQEINDETGELTGERVHLTSGHASNAKWCEGPHIYKIKGKYLMLCAEGGTWDQHAVTAFLADKVMGPYEPLATNPVMTHRHLGRKADITTTGHADLVQTQKGDWHAVMLGVRPINGFRNLGRETFLTKVEFEGHTPIFNPGFGRIFLQERRPALPWTPVPQLPDRDDFDSIDLRFCWNFLRTPVEKWWEIDAGKGILAIELRPQQTTELVNPSYIARRQEHHKMQATTKMVFNPKGDNEIAGLVAMQNDKYQYQLLLMQEGRQQYIALVKVAAPDRKEEANSYIVAKVPYENKEVVLSIKANKLKYSFYYGTDENSLAQIGDVQDGTILTSNVAGGFIGAYIGMYASSKGEASRNKAVFDWFEYKEIK